MGCCDKDGPNFIHADHNRQALLDRFDANSEVVVNLFRAVAAFRRGFNFFKPLIPKTAVRGFLADPVAFEASGNKWADDAKNIAKIICQVASIVCPLVGE